MKIGVSRPFADPGAPINDVDMGEIGRMAEEIGFDWLTYGHHTVRPIKEEIKGPHTHGVPFYQDPLIGAARATALTTRLEVSTGVLIMPMKHPVDVAKQVATIDAYSNGRFMLGLGTGGASRIEIEASGGSFEKRWAYTMESIAVMKGLWTQDSFSFDGEFFKFPAVQMYPRPHRKPYPPILLGGYSDAVLERVAQHCDGWLPAYAGTKLLTLSETDMTGPEHLQQGRKKLMQMAQAAGRDVKHFEIGVILAPGDEKRELRNIYEDAGADRLAVSMPHVETLEQARAALERIAGNIL